MRRPLGAALVLTVLMSVPGCVRREPGPGGAAGPEGASASAPGADSVAIELERTPCFGGCPVYTVRLTSAGTVEFEGRRFVAQEGRAEGSVDPATVRALAAEMERAGWFGFDDRYTPGEPNCPSAPTDLPGASTTLVVGSRSKRIDRYGGCREAPAAIEALERRIDSVAGTARWIGR